MIVSLPMFAALKEKFPGSHITFAAAPTNYSIPFFDINPFIDEVMIYDRSSLKSLWKFYRELWKRKYDIAIALSTIKISRTVHLICFLSGAKLRLGVKSIDDKKNKSAYLLNIKKPFKWNKERKHQGERGLELISQLFDSKLLINDFPDKLKLSFGCDDIKNAEKFLQQFKDERFIIGIHPGAGKKENIWDNKKFIDVISNFSKKKNVNIVITCGELDNEIVSKITSGLKELNIPFLTAKDFGLKALAALINNFDLYITNDTGPMHIAGSTKVDQISIFGPTEEWEWAPIGKNKLSVKSASNNINDIPSSEILQKISEFNVI